MTIHRRVAGAHEAPSDPRPLDEIIRQRIREMGAGGWEELSQEAQRSLAEEFYCTPQVIGTVLTRAAQQRARAQQQVRAARARGGGRQRATNKPKGRGANVSTHGRTGEPDVVSSITDRIDEDQELRTRWPMTLAAIDHISDRLGIDTSKSPSLRKAWIEDVVMRELDRKRHALTPDGDKAWDQYRSYERMLRNARTADMERHQRGDEAIAWLGHKQQSAHMAARMQFDQAIEREALRRSGRR